MGNGARSMEWKATTTTKCACNVGLTEIYIISIITIPKNIKLEP